LSATFLRRPISILSKFSSAITCLFIGVEEFLWARGYTFSSEREKERGYDTKWTFYAGATSRKILEYLE